MFVFTYTAKDEDGNIVESKYEAESQEYVFTYLVEKGWVPLKVKCLENTNLTWRERLLLLIPFRKKTVRYFMLELTIMLKSGLSLPEVLFTLSQNHPSKRIRLIVEHVRWSLLKGDSFWEAFGYYRRSLRNIFSIELMGGEQEGRLVDMLEQLYQSQDTKTVMATKIFIDRSPQFMSLVIICVLFVVIGYDLYAQYISEVNRWLGDKTVPALTAFVFSVLSFFHNHWYVVPVSLVAIWSVFYVLRKISITRFFLDWLVLYCYPFSPLVKSINMDLFLNYLCLFLKWGYPMQDAIKQAGLLLPNLVLKRRSGQLVEYLKEGCSLEQAAKQSGLFSWWELQLFAIPSKQHLQKVLSEMIKNNKDRLTVITSVVSQSVRFVVYFIISVFTAVFYQGWMSVYIELTKPLQ